MHTVSPGEGEIGMRVKRRGMGGLILRFAGSADVSPDAAYFLGKSQR
jgi:hypothetical protein